MEFLLSAMEMDCLNWIVENYLPLNIKNDVHKALFEGVDALTDEQFQSLSKEQKDWQKQFGVELENSLTQQLEFRTQLEEREEGRKRRSSLLAKGMSMVNVVTSTPKASFGVINEDGKMIYVDVDSNKWAQKKLPSALFRRLASEQKQKEFMNSALIIDSSKLPSGLKRRIELERVKSVFHVSRSYSSNDTIQSGDNSNDFIGEAVLLELPVLNSKAALEMFFGVQEWDQEILSLSLFGNKDLSWGTGEALHQAVRNFVGLAKCAFGPHMEALLPPLLKMMNNNSVKFIVADNMMFLIYFINNVIYNLWCDLRLPYHDDSGVLVSLGDLGWVEHVRKLCSNVFMDDIRVLLFNTQILPRVPAILLPQSKASTSHGGKHTHSSASEGGRLSSQSSTVTTKTAPVESNTSQEKRRKVEVDSYCIRYVGGCLKIPNFPACPFSKDDCRFIHCDLNKIDFEKLKVGLSRTFLVNKNMKERVEVEFLKKFSKQK